jgi:predicted  nucleic acid-binding Zn-ribbon protein
VIEARAAEIREDIEQHIEDKEILKSHTELNNLKEFGQWIAHVGEGKLK